jgi:CBS domain-containing protein
MQRRTKTKLARGLFVDRDIALLKQQLVRFQPFLSRKASGHSLEDYDQASERLISRIFGDSSEMLEAYEYARVGEAASLVNLPEEAQEAGARDTYRESLQQRKRVLESCIMELEAMRPTAGRNAGGGALAGATVADYMSSDVRSVHRDAPLKEAGRLLSKWKVGSLLVDDDRRYVGIITDTDLSRKGVGRGLDPSATPVKTCMSKPVITIEDSEPLAAAIARMKTKGIRHIAVTEDGTIIGILSVSDILRAYTELAGLGREGDDADEE